MCGAMALPYRNALAQASDLDGFVMEGDGAVSFPQGRLRLKSTRPASDGQLANIVYWVPGTFGDRIAVEWSFLPVREPGLAILFFAARGRTGSPYRVARPGRPRVARVLVPSTRPWLGVRVASGLVVGRRSRRSHRAAARAVGGQHLHQRRRPVRARRHPVDRSAGRSAGVGVALRRLARARPQSPHEWTDDPFSRCGRLAPIGRGDSGRGALAGAFRARPLVTLSTVDPGPGGPHRPTP